MTDTPTRLLMLDSGAFTVWTQEAEIDLDAYIGFCQDHEDCSYYVNLDVIPGKPGDKSTLTRDAVEQSCKQGWDNWREMIDVLPRDKVIPVFHQGDHLKWLERYLEAGVKYIGISPANDRQTSGSNHKATLPGRGDQQTTKLQWIRSLRPYLFDGAGRPVVRTHGFAVTSYDLMKCMEWHSVDSASWKLAGAWGSIYVPRGGKSFDFTTEPEQIRASGTSGQTRLGSEIGAVKLAPMSERTLSWLQTCGVPVGEFKTKKVDGTYKLDREREEIWFNKQERVVLVPVVKGVLTSVEERLRVNAEFIKRANDALKEYVRHIYFAGALMPYPLEFNLGRRLLSYYHLKGKSARRQLRTHLKSVRKLRKSK